MENGTVIDVRHTIFFVKGDIKRVHPEFLDEWAELYTILPIKRTLFI
jgi:hypothetical protein